MSAARLAELEYIAAMPAAEHCWMCRGVDRAQKVAVVDIPLCAGHRDDLVTSLRAFATDHPDDVCTDTCGCMTLDELKASLAIDES